MRNSSKREIPVDKRQHNTVKSRRQPQPSGIGSLWLLALLVCVYGVISFNLPQELLVDDTMIELNSSPSEVQCNSRSTLTWPTPTSLSAELQFVCETPNPIISFIHVEKPIPSSKRPSVLCILLTQSKSHNTRVKTIQQTWGKFCDGWIAASDATDRSVGAYEIQAEKGYWGIWDKLMQTLRMVLEEPSSARQTDAKGQPYQHLNFDMESKKYDWILKADDDTFVIMENLHSFLYNLTKQYDSKYLQEQPLVFGRTMPWPKLAVLKDFGWFDKSLQMKTFGHRLYQRFGKNHTLVYPHGGPGYIMNWKYAQILADAYFDSDDAAKGLISEDLANAVTMLYHGILPNSTFDDWAGRERSHPESPGSMYDNRNWLPLVQSKIQHRGDLDQCCSPTSISYHHVSEIDMKLLHYQLHHCK